MHAVGTHHGALGGGEAAGEDAHHVVAAELGVGDLAAVAQECHLNVSRVVAHVVRRGRGGVPTVELGAAARGSQRYLGAVDAVLARGKMQAHGAQAAAVLDDEVGDHRAIVHGHVVLGAEVVGPVTRHGVLETASRREVVDVVRRAVFLAVREDLTPVSAHHIGIHLNLVLDAGLRVEGLVADLLCARHLLLRLVVRTGHPSVHDVEIHAEGTAEAVGSFVDHEHVLTHLARLVHGEAGSVATADHKDVGVVDRVGHPGRDRLIVAAGVGHLLLGRAAGHAGERDHAGGEPAELEERATIHAAAHLLLFVVPHPSLLSCGVLTGKRLGAATGGSKSWFAGVIVDKAKRHLAGTPSPLSRRP